MQLNECTMNPDHRETIQRLFALSAMLSSRIESTSVSGQSHSLQRNEYEVFAQELQELAGILNSMAAAVLGIIQVDRAEG